MTIRLLQTLSSITTLPLLLTAVLPTLSRRPQPLAQQPLPRQTALRPRPPPCCSIRLARSVAPVSTLPMMSATTIVHLTPSTPSTTARTRPPRRGRRTAPPPCTLRPRPPWGPMAVLAAATPSSSRMPISVRNGNASLRANPLVMNKSDGNSRPSEMPFSLTFLPPILPSRLKMSPFQSFVTYVSFFLSFPFF